MTPGPTFIVKAPGCSKLVKISTISSGNTCGATYWTDGKCEAPMLPDSPWLRVSPAEGILFWSDECEKIAEMHPWKSTSGAAKWDELMFAAEPNEKEYFEALTSGIATTQEKLRYIRMRLWWAGNDPIRRGQTAVLPPVHIENLALLADLLSSSDPNQRLMKADALRELGRFRDAGDLLKCDFPEEYAGAVAIIQALVNAKNSRVSKMTT